MPGVISPSIPFKFVADTGSVTAGTVEVAGMQLLSVAEGVVEAQSSSKRTLSSQCCKNGSPNGTTHIEMSRWVIGAQRKRTVIGRPFRGDGGAGEWRGISLELRSVAHFGFFEKRPISLVVVALARHDSVGCRVFMNLSLVTNCLNMFQLSCKRVPYGHLLLQCIIPREHPENHPSNTPITSC